LENWKIRSKESLFAGHKDLISISKFNSKVSLCEVHFSDSPHGGYTYRMPKNYEQLIPGIRVRVPFGPRLRVGFLTSTFQGHNQPNYKDISEALDVTPLFSTNMLKLTLWISEYYLCYWGEVLAASIPAGLKQNNRVKYQFTKLGLSQGWVGKSNDEAAQLWKLVATAAVTLKQIRKCIPKGEKLLGEFQDRGWIEAVQYSDNKQLYRLENLWEWTGEIDFDIALESLSANATKIRKAVEILSQSNGSLKGADLLRMGEGLNAQLRSLVKRKWVSLKKIPRDLDGISQEGISETGAEVATLTELQLKLVNEVINACLNNSSKVFLLHGVTGSGKTLVYLEVVERVIKSGKNVIVLIPEISLTPQLTGRFRRRFGDAVVLTHSRMSIAQRRDIWYAVKSGRVKVVIGPRSAIFSPMQNIGLILVDEEHDESFKQSSPAPRYNGRDTAIYRAHLEGAVTLIGSATPDVSSYFNASKGKYQLLEMQQRYLGAKLPEVEIAQWGVGKEGRIFSPALKDKIKDRLNLKEQIIILVNRRGFSSCIRCPECGSVAECPNCDIMLRYHTVGNKLECHYCGHMERAFDKCPNCRGIRLRYNGIGTQRVEKELAHYFPMSRIARMDLDTTKGAGSHQEILSSFGKGEYDILLGTKMVAKGHDFPNVTLVGIIAADMEWLRPDFRATEKAFRLLVQASGRAGRRKEGEVVIQSWQPTNEILEWVRGHNYFQMYKSEMRVRKQLAYPPFGRLIIITFTGENRDRVRETAKSFSTEISVSLPQRIILGPAPPPIERLENMFRQRILIKLPYQSNDRITAEKKKIWEMICAYNKQYAKWNIRLSIDVDPVEL